MDTLWGAVLASGWSPPLLVFLMSTTALSVAAFSHSLAYVAVALWPTRAVEAYKLQPHKHVSARDLKVLAANVPVVLLTAVVPSFVVTAALGLRVDRQLPGVPELLTHLLACALLEEVAFYGTHIALHHPALYTRFHKKHHEFTAPCAIAASYAHPVESLLGNVLPIALGPVLVRAHLVTACVYYAAASIVTQVHHSGYRFPWNVDHQPDFHDAHHRYFSTAFGLLGICDIVFQTDTLFYAKRHAALGRRQRFTGHPAAFRATNAAVLALGLVIAVGVGRRLSAASATAAVGHKCFIA